MRWTKPFVFEVLSDHARIADAIRTADAIFVWAIGWPLQATREATEQWFTRFGSTDRAKANLFEDRGFSCLHIEQA